ncbi:hypothetical protein SO802_017136 [Lithocarpus litseifolius]|uniref:Uncharacterized protein n=1 Tax=Lithocarpus litseifolius TaxID=425828 RepID=A0AAW2D2L7_9ROSI
MKRPSLHWYNVCNKLDHQQQQQNAAQGSMTREDLDPRVTLHHGIPSTASVLAFDSIQSLLAIGTLRIASTLQWESNITAFSVIYGTTYMYIGCEFGMVAVLKYDAESKKIIHLPYCVPKNAIAVAIFHSGIFGKCTMNFTLANILLFLLDKPVVNCPKDTRHELSDDESDDRELDKEMSSICWASDSGLVLAVGYIDGDIMFWNLPNAASIQDQKAAKSSITMLLSYNYYQAAEDSLSLFCIGLQIDHIMIVGANSLSMAVMKLDLKKF